MIEKLLLNVAKNKKARVLKKIKSKDYLKYLQENRESPIELLILENASTDMIQTLLTELPYSNEFYEEFNHSFGVPVVAKLLIDNNANMEKALELIHGEISYDFACKKFTIFRITKFSLIP